MHISMSSAPGGGGVAGNPGEIRQMGKVTAYRDENLCLIPEGRSKLTRYYETIKLTNYRFSMSISRRSGIMSLSNSCLSGFFLLSNSPCMPTARPRAAKTLIGALEFNNINVNRIIATSLQYRTG